MCDLTAIAYESGGLWWLRFERPSAPGVRFEYPPGCPPLVGPFGSEAMVRGFIEFRIAWSEMAAQYGHRRWIEDHVTARHRAEAVAGMTWAATRKGE